VQFNSTTSIDLLPMRFAFAALIAIASLATFGSTARASNVSAPSTTKPPMQLGLHGLPTIPEGAQMLRTFTVAIPLQHPFGEAQGQLRVEHVLLQVGHRFWREADRCKLYTHQVVGMTPVVQGRTMALRPTLQSGTRTVACERAQDDLVVAGNTAMVAVQDLPSGEEGVWVGERVVHRASTNECVWQQQRVANKQANAQGPWRFGDLSISRQTKPVACDAAIQAIQDWTARGAG
jgi:hypothetical protein